MEQSTLSAYIQQSLGFRPILRDWQDPPQLKLFLRGRYDFQEIKLLDTVCLLARVRNPRELTPATFAKDRDTLCDESGFPIVFWIDEMEAHNRSRLVDRKVCFIVPGRQLYLPHLGIDFVEYSRRKNHSFSRPHTFSPSVQAVALALIQNPVLNEMRPVPLSLVTERVIVPPDEEKRERPAYSKQSVSRAFDHLIATGAFSEKMRGRERYIHFETSPRNLWHELHLRFRSPVRKKIYRRYRKGLKLPEAGLSALSRRTSLGPSGQQSFAVRKFEPLEPYLELVHEYDPDAMAIEAWRYEPLAVLGRATPRSIPSFPGVDNLSLYLSLQDNPDERVQGALEDLLEQTFA